MTTKTKEHFIGPKLTKVQRQESLEFWTKLSTPIDDNEINLGVLEETINSIEWTNDLVDKFISILKSKKTSTHKSGPALGVGRRCRELILEGFGNKAILEMIKIEFPNNNTTYSCVAWYRNDMKSKGEL